MTRFQDYLKAEIFAETFSKIFFSGSSGRSVAVVFAITYAFFSTVFMIFSFLLGIVFRVLGTIVSTYLNSRFRIRRKAVGNLKRSVRKLGDRMEIRKGNGWNAYEIFGTGLRTGDFRIALVHHPKTGAVRFFKRTSDVQEELDQNDVLRFLGGGATYVRIEDFPLVYRNLRTHVL